MFFRVNFKFRYRIRVWSFGIPVKVKTSNLDTVDGCGLLVFQSKLKLLKLNFRTVRTTILRIQSSHHNFSNQNLDNWKLNKTFFLKEKKKTQYVKTFYFLYFYKKELKGHFWKQKELWVQV